jgi:hypothetical protein
MDRSRQHPVEFLALSTAAAIVRADMRSAIATLRRVGRTFQRRRNQSTSDSTTEMIRQVTIGK